MTRVVPISDAGTLRSHLEQYRDFVAQMNQPAAGSYFYQGDLDLALREGREFASVPWKSWRGSGYRRMKERQCFKNAHLHAHMHDELTYCEGYATRLGLPILHAWCVDPEGRVVDPTWREDADAPPVETWEYLGIPFELDFIDKLTVAKGCYGVLDDYDIYKYPLPDGAKKGVLG